MSTANSKFTKFSVSYPQEPYTVASTPAGLDFTLAEDPSAPPPPQPKKLSPKLVPGVLVRTPSANGYWVRMRVDLTTMEPSNPEIVRYEDGVIVQGDLRMPAEAAPNVCYVLLW